MRERADLETKFGSASVRILDDPAFAGLLQLRGRDTTLTVAGDRLFARETDSNGWFDVTVQASDGESVLLHHALETSSATFYSHVEKFEKKIYPNVVVCGRTESLGVVKSISFKLQGLRHFFHYQHVEHHSAYGSSDKVNDAVRRLREYDHMELHASRQQLGIAKEREYDFTRPREIYVVHTIPRIFKFNIADRYYQIGMRQRRKGPGWSGIDHVVEPVATITFANAVGIDEALEFMWEWQQFFVQVAMEPLRVLGITTRPSTTDSASNDVYLPALDVGSDVRELRFHPMNAPYNRWGQRRQAGDAMRAWLLMSRERRKFRDILARALRHFHTRADPNTIVSLCAALESLSELTPTPRVSKQEIADMAAAAAGVLEGDNKQQVSVERLINVLSTLRRPSLLERFAKLTSELVPELNAEHIKNVTAHAYRLRNTAAHGRSGEQATVPVVGPVVEALTCMCVLYDLKTSGLPASWEHGNLVCLQHWHSSIAALNKFAVDMPTRQR